MSARQGRSPGSSLDRGRGGAPSAGRTDPVALSLERLFELSRDLLCIAGIDGRFRRVNPAFVETLGWSEHELLERPFLDFVHPQDRAATEAEVARLAQGLPTISFENRYLCADGSWVHLHWTSQPDPDAGLLYAIARDVGPQKRIEAELRNAKEAAETADRMKSQFLASLSHEIRTPMNGILGMTELALEHSTNPVVRDQLEIVRESAEALLHLLDDLLDLARIESGNLRLERAPFRIRRLVDGIVRSFETLVGRRPIELRTEIDPDLPDVWIGDAARLRQILVNLLGNAVKFTARGEVRIACRARRREQRPGLEVAVSDTGPGIGPDRLESIFERYTQYHSDVGNAPRGAGLGLAISAQLTRAMGGSLVVDSEVTQGSTFQLWLPLVAGDDSDLPSADPGDRAADAQVTLPPLRVLVAEDSPTNQAVARGFLERYGHSVELVDTGKLAVEAVAGGRFDLVLMDLEMPEMDGIEATREIREAERETGRHLPILALTAHALSAQRAACCDAGMDGFVAKPLRQSQLLAAIKRALATSGADASSSSPAAGGRNPRGLVDWHEARRVVGGHDTILRKVVAAGAAELPELADRLSEALESADAESAQRLAHTLKGALQPFGASQLVSDSERLEDSARRNDLSETRRRFQALEPSLRALGTELRRADETWDHSTGDPAGAASGAPSSAED
ncbi:MAG TPA: response regulator [Thermoanaerobaculia bacterium]|nr:response regulator [Thermoanaerobaculia bacterium]